MPMNLSESILFIFADTYSQLGHTRLVCNFFIILSLLQMNDQSIVAIAQSILYTVSTLLSFLQVNEQNTVAIAVLSYSCFLVFDLTLLQDTQSVQTQVLQDTQSVQTQVLTVPVGYLVDDAAAITADGHFFVFRADRYDSTGNVEKVTVMAVYDLKNCKSSVAWMDE